jgi:zinc transport system substrate-binding protein
VQVSLEEDGKSPSMKHMKSVLKDAKNEGVKTIFIQKEFDVSMAKTIADDIGGRVVVVDPLDYNWLSNMFITADLIKDALNGN